MHVVRVFDTTPDKQGNSGVQLAWQTTFPSLAAAQSYASRQHMTYRVITICDTSQTEVYDSRTSDGTSPADAPSNQGSTMPRRPQPVAKNPTVTLAVYGTGESSTENTTALLDDFIEGIGEATIKFVVPVGKVTTTDPVQDIVTYALDKGHEYVAVHHEAVGRTKRLKDILDGAAEVVKADDTSQAILDLVGKARDARLLFFWNEDPDVDVEDEQRLLNAVIAADVVALDVIQGMEPIAPDEGGAEEPTEEPAEETPAAAEEPTEEPDAPVTEDTDPTYEQAKTFSVRRLRTFAVEIGYEDADVNKMPAKDLLAMLYPEETEAEAAAEETPDERVRTGREIREAVEAEKAAEEPVEEPVEEPAEEPQEAPKPSRRRTTKAEPVEKPQEPVEAPDEAQADLTGASLVAGDIAEAIAESLADLVIDKVIERLRARALEASKEDIVRDLVPPRRPGRPRKDAEE